MPEEFKNVAMNGRFGFEFEKKKLGQGNRTIIVRSQFSKSSLFKMFSVQTKTELRRVHILPI